MRENLFVIAKENGKIVFRRGAYAAVMFLFLVPFLYGTAGLDREKAADCLGRLVALVGIPLFVFLLKPEQEPGVRDIMLIREFPYRVMICLRMVFAAFLSVILICFLYFICSIRDAMFLLLYIRCGQLRSVCLSAGWDFWAVRLLEGRWQAF